jgi:hypothetical protein
MKNTPAIIVCAVTLGAFAAPASQAAGGHAPGGVHLEAPAVQLNSLANLGHEGSGLARHRRRATRSAHVARNGFADLGVEGSGLAATEAAALRPWAN